MDLSKCFYSSQGKLECTDSSMQQLGNNWAFDNGNYFSKITPLTDQTKYSSSTNETIYGTFEWGSRNGNLKAYPIDSLGTWVPFDNKNGLQNNSNVPNSGTFNNINLIDKKGFIYPYYSEYRSTLSSNINSSNSFVGEPDYNGYYSLI